MSQTKTCEITNNSGKDIVVALYLQPGQSTCSNGILSSDLGMELLKTSGNDTVIKNGSKGTVTLDRMFTAGVPVTGNVMNYDIVISDANWTYPLAYFEVIQDASVNNSILVTADSQVGTTQAFSFYQTMAAFPGSDLSHGYFDAIGQAKTAAETVADGTPGSIKKAIAAINDAIQKFFQGTDDYKQVTMGSLVAVDNYYKSLPSVWTQYKDSMTYYLYGSDPEKSTFEGTLTIVKPAKIDITKATGDYACTFVPATNPDDFTKVDTDDSRATTMFYREGIFVSDKSAAKPGIGLKGAFLLKNLLVSSDDTDIITIVGGKVNGRHTIGFTNPQTSRKTIKTMAMAAGQPGDGDTSEDSFWDMVINPKTVYERMISTLTIVGILTAIPLTIAILSLIYLAIKNKLQGDDGDDDSLSRKDFDHISDDATSKGTDSDAVLFMIYSDDDPGVLKVADFEAMARKSALLENRLLRDKMLAGLDEQSAAAELLMEQYSRFNHGQQLQCQKMQSKLSETIEGLEDATADTIAATVKAAPEALADIQGRFGKLYSEVTHLYNLEAEKMIDGHNENAIEQYKEATKMQRQNEEEQSGRPGKLREEITPELELS